MWDVFPTWLKRKELLGKKPKEVRVLFTEIKFIKFQFITGIFQNIHDSFDEIDSKTLNNVYKKAKQPSENQGKNGQFYCIKYYSIVACQDCLQICDIVPVLTTDSIESNHYAVQRKFVQRL